ncbi:mitochondrial inner membrane translocase [Dunaliella salina]|uniref:Mitochondrial import inner membrane translocase subunit n=1 Tax=Dunaliella salina TaxID=3046 RepID=A0ABQ7H5C6_DUNSA|nr:mitochondrial inner membrane translocase [Dunaliella salina]|eukprot:KAF5842059.1 mitochondrial inner membrane translocase [Dunaliella salina]
MSSPPSSNDINDPANQAAAGAALALATTELEYRVELLNKMVASCYDKCAARPFKEGTLSVGENSCVDRCCAKYWQVVAIVGQLLGAQK